MNRRLDFMPATRTKAMKSVPYRVGVQKARTWPRTPCRDGDHGRGQVRVAGPLERANQMAVRSEVRAELKPLAAPVGRGGLP
eukprot:9283373-Pyramimonas_sp.AAC.1